MENEIIIHHDNDVWRIIGMGSIREGKVFCHLASMTRMVEQKNGSRPIQISDWIDLKRLPCQGEPE